MGAATSAECCTKRDEGGMTARKPKTTGKNITPEACYEHLEEEEKDQQATVQHYVFNWLEWAPEPESACYISLHKNFPGAIPGQALHMRVKGVLTSEEHGFTPENTLFGASICPDEINNEIGDLADIMRNFWGEQFPLGGISGAPFVGSTGFSAFSHHVPDDGHIVILFGPHVAIAENGEVGKYLREGQHHLSTACGAVIGAYNACCQKTIPDDEGGDELDMQMAWIKAQLEPHAAKIKQQKNPMAALAYQAYEMVRAKLEKIVDTKFGTGKLVLVGGIMINMPKPYDDHFLPMMFDVHQEGKTKVSLISEFQCPLTQVEMTNAGSKGETFSPDSKGKPQPKKKPELKKAGSKNFDGWRDVKSANDTDALMRRQSSGEADAKACQQHQVFGWLSWSSQPGTAAYKTLHAQFPCALPGMGVHCRVRQILSRSYDFTPENCLFGTSICPDEINNMPSNMATLMAEYWGEVFPMGGIGGAPFVGKTGFKAFSHHVPDDGHILILYGPHVAISEDGEVGKYLREGQKHESTACGAVIGAYNACCAMKEEDDEEFDEADMQMGWIKSQLTPHVETISEQECPLAALSYQAFESVNTKMNKIVNTTFGSGRLVLLGGIQINMPSPCIDHFLPLVFEVRQEGMPTESLLESFNCPITQDALHKLQSSLLYHHESDSRAQSPALDSES